MKPVYQTRFGAADSPREEAGNCMDACVASVLEISLDDAPDKTPLDFPDAEGWHNFWEEWFAERGIASYSVRFKYGSPRGYTIASLRIRKHDCGHAVVCCDGEIVHDPNPHNKPYPADTEIEDHHVFCALNPADIPRREASEVVS